MASTDPVLTLNTLTDRTRIKINNKTYELRSRDEFAFLSYRRHARRFARLSELLQAKTSTAAQEKEQSALLDELCRVVLDAPPAVHAGLRDPHRMQILAVFSGLLRPTRSAGAVPRTKRRRVRASAA